MMMDKRVVTCDFMGIRVGHIVRVGGRIGLVIDRFTSPRLLDEGHYEVYDAMLVVLLDGRRLNVFVEDVEIIDDDT